MKNDFIFITLYPSWLAEVWESRCLWIWILNGLHLFLAGTITVGYFGFLVLFSELSIVPRHVWESIWAFSDTKAVNLSFWEHHNTTVCMFVVAVKLHFVVILTGGGAGLWLWHWVSIWGQMAEQLNCQVQWSDSKYRQSPIRIIDYLPGLNKYQLNCSSATLHKPFSLQVVLLQPF